MTLVLIVLGVLLALILVIAFVIPDEWFDIGEDDGRRHDYTWILVGSVPVRVHSPWCDHNEEDA